MPSGSVTPTAVTAPFNGGTITTPLTITPSDGTADPLKVTLQFAESFIFGTTGGTNNMVYFKDASNGHPIEITDSYVRLGNSSFIASSLVVQDANTTVTAPVGKRFNITDGVVDRFTTSSTFVKFHQTVVPDDGDLDAGDCALWLDQTNGAAKLMVKGKSANGTVVSAAIALA